MGNTLQNGSEIKQNTQRRQPKIFIETTKKQQICKETSQEYKVSNQECQIKRNHSLNNSIDKSHSFSKQKKFLSLSKAISTQNTFLADSKCKKGIVITAHQEVPVKSHLERFIKFDSDHTQPKSNQTIKKMAIKPRDLPRYSSHKSILTSASPNHIPQQPAKNQSRPSVSHIRPISNLNQPNIRINYVEPAQITIKPTNVIKSSVVIPFGNKYNASNSTLSWHPNQIGDNNAKKLKKVALSRSQVQQDQPSSLKSLEIENQQTKRRDYKIDNQEQESKVNVCSASTIKRLQDKQNRAILTDPNLFSQIKANQDLEHFKESESKYAVAYEQNGSIVQRSINLQHLNWASPITKQKYSVGFWRQSENETLQDKVEREVQSKAMIEQREGQSKVLIEQPFRFQTATDISIEERSDNTSFVPIPNHFRRQLEEGVHIEPDQILSYCKPKINEKVLADLLRLPLKQ